ncbi:hypothetical protein BN946_scf184939.g44 [Trametes cinnabarina]|uniref:Enoyl reductase (ER) domain-containing protein n=1 Tax=Pycnoporus cinnabarinus TaxID=5643 RepID=A0A060SBW2_PYCCI|nr:hypothetical protein BN946_scf184939.g44 [Trametes cinnabarina]
MSIPKTQKALLLPEKQGQWSLTEVPVPTPGPKEVLIKVTATALNPVDWKIQAYGAFIQNYPWIGGTDAAGVVEEIPDNVTEDQAASVPLALATVVTGLYNHHPHSKSVNFTAPWEEGGTTKFAGKPAFILGGSSSVGQYAIQLAKLSGFSPIIATASPHNAQLLLSLGATHVIDRSLPPAAIKQELSKLTGGKPIEFVYDAISLPDTQAIAYDALAPGGVLLLVLPESIPAELKKEGDNKKIVNVFGNVHPPENREVGVQLYKHLTEWLQKGIIVPNKVEVLPNGLAGIPEGLERLKNNKVSGHKLIARPQETP